MRPVARYVISVISGSVALILPDTTVVIGLYTYFNFRLYDFYVQI